MHASCIHVACINTSIIISIAHIHAWINKANNLIVESQGILGICCSTDVGTLQAPYILMSRIVRRIHACSNSKIDELLLSCRALPRGVDQPRKEE